MNDSPQATPETESAEPSRKKSFAPVIYGTLIVLALYVLSTGPMCRLVFQFKISTTTFAKVYQPLIGLGASSPAVQNLFEWYVHFWTKDLPIVRDQPHPPER
jgi:hypothetical protein